MPSILAILNRPICTKFWTYRNLNSTCLVFLPVPKRVAVDLPAVLSVCAITLTFFASFKQCFRHSLTNRIQLRFTGG